MKKSVVYLFIYLTFLAKTGNAVRTVCNLLQGVSYQNKTKQKKCGAAMGKMHLPGTVPGNYLQPYCVDGLYAKAAYARAT